jgi:hypothetical protein
MISSKSKKKLLIFNRALNNKLGKNNFKEKRLEKA